MIEDEAGTRLELTATRDQLDQMADTLDDILLHDSATDEELEGSPDGPAGACQAGSYLRHSGHAASSTHLRVQGGAGRAGLAAALLGQDGTAWAQDNFPACLQTLRAAAGDAGVSAQTFDQVAGTLQPNDVLHFQTEQPEFHTAVWDYMAGLVDDERVADGRAKAREWSAALGPIQSRFGVDADILVAVWGVESDYGKTFGFRPIVQSLATLACYGQRPPISDPSSWPP